ncbi:MAG: response regulator [Myxococcaceae bacterium]
MSPGSRGDPGVSRSVLLVDDDPGVLAAFRRLMRVLPVRVLEARGAEEALELIEDELPSVVISDFEMPRMDGGQLIAQIRARWPRIRCVLHSGRASLPDLGPDVPVLPKPCESGVFLATLRSLLAGLGPEPPAR